LRAIEGNGPRRRQDCPRGLPSAAPGPLGRLDPSAGLGGVTVIGEHQDKDLSGGRADNRPGLQEAIATACARKAVLVVYSLSRLARCTKDAIDLAVLQENVNTRSPMGRFIFTLFSALAQLEREQIAERTSSAMLRHQAKGRRMTRHSLAEDGEEQAAIARIRAEHRQGKGLRAIARALDRAGIDCRDRRWSHSAVRSVLRRAGYLARAF
jgi:hypothetical protein